MNNDNKRHNGISCIGILIGMVGLGWNIVASAEEEPRKEGMRLSELADMIHIEGGLTWFLQATDGAVDDTTDLTYTFDLGLESQISEHGKVVIALEAGDGLGVDTAVGALSAVNYDAFFTDSTDLVPGATNIVSPSVSQAYYEGDYMDGGLVISAGKLDIHSMFDDNAYANDETDQFMSAIFTRSADTSYAQVDYYYAPGVVAQYGISDKVDVELIVANGNGSGFNDIFNYMYIVGQVNFKPNLGGHDGNYRFYFINDGRKDAYTEISSGNTTSNNAWGLSFDQAVADHAGVFIRYSEQDDGIVENTVSSSWSLGALFEGASWGRENDTIGIAYGSVNLNTDPAALAAAGIASANADDETHLEAFYKYGVSDNFTLTADIQVVENVGGDSTADTVTVPGLRGQLNF